MVLLARDRDALEMTKKEIKAVAKGVKVHIISTDLGVLYYLHADWKSIMEIADSAKYSQHVLIHNAGTMNSFDKPLEEFTDPNEIQDYFALNYTSMAVLTAHFLDAFKSGHRCVVNLTSLLATSYIPGFPLYSPARAARNAYMGVLTAEKPDVRTLNYSPGPCLTDMLDSIPKEISDKFDGKLTPQESIVKFVKILKDDKFKNGVVIDYYD